jgi:carbamoyltransferase
MIVLGVHPGMHDASAALLDDYRVLGAVQLERLNRAKGSGIEREAWAWPCVDELLSMQGLRRSDVDAVAFTRESFPRIYLHKMQTPLRRLATTLAPGKIAKRPTKILINALSEERSHDPATLFDIDGFLADSGFRSDVQVHWCNHHFGHAITALFFTDWADALIYTADGRGDNVCSSARSLAEGKISCLFGGEETLLDPLRLDSLGFAYGLVTRALGFRMLRHEGKVTGLAAYGEPTLYERMAEHFSVDAKGRVWCDWTDFPEIGAEMEAIVNGARREDAAASVQMLVEQVTLDSLSRILRQVPHRLLGLAGGLFANVKLNRFLRENLDLDEIFIAPPMGERDFRSAQHSIFCWTATAFPNGLIVGTGSKSSIGGAIMAPPSIAYWPANRGLPAPARLRSKAPRRGWPTARSALFSAAEWNSGRAPWGPVRSSPTPAGARCMTS